MALFEISHLTFTYPGQDAPALSDLSLELKPGEFTALIGPSGCGKSTFLRQLKTVLTPHGERSGEILFDRQALGAISARTQAARIGFVQQSSENQLVTDKVWHELAFGLESLGLKTPEIRTRVAETASFFGIQNWFYKDISELSGGQKQLLNLACVMAMQPDILILDEPTAQLDPIAAADFLAAVGKINRELGTTVIMTEHRLEDVFPLTTRVLVLDGGKLISDGTLAQTGTFLKESGHSMFLSMPTPMRVWTATKNPLPCPLSVCDGRAWLSDFAQTHALGPLPPEKAASEASRAPAVALSDVWFRYGKNAPDVVKGLSLKAHFGEFLCILGGNGTGKTTALSLISGQNRPYRGKIARFSDSVAALPQNPQLLFLKSSVLDELMEMLAGQKLPLTEKQRQALEIARLCRIESLLYRHPYDLSGGEMQRAALAKVLLLHPKILLLDEPTKGLDAEFKRVFAGIIKKLTENGVCVIMVSHDIAFCAEYADRCALFFDGSIVSENTPRAFFGGNSFYTTAASRMARTLLPGAVTAGDVICACGGRPEPPLDDGGGTDSVSPERPEKAVPPGVGALPLWRKILALISGSAALGAFVYALRTVDVKEILTSGALSGYTGAYKAVYAVLLASLFIFALSISRKAEKAPAKALKQPLPKRTLAALIMILLAVPLTVFAGIFWLDDRKYYFISLLVILESTLPFALIFESRRPQARELVVIAVLCALGIAGRAAFFALPGFKPVMAIVIISGVAFGGEAGFLVGAVTMFASNMLFGQGPWTPWQMFAMGISGFLAGGLFSKGRLSRDRLSLCVFGALATLLIYGGMMNPAAMLMSQPAPTLGLLLTAYAVGFPVDLVHAAATFTFLWFFSRPLLEKLDRIRIKYGLTEA